MGTPRGDGPDGRTGAVTLHINNQRDLSPQLADVDPQTNMADITLLDQAGYPVRRVPVPIKPLAAYLRRLTVGQLDIGLPNETTLSVKGPRPGPKADMQVHRWRMLPRAVIRGDVGLGEAFMAGDWDSPDVSQLLQFFAANTLTNGEQFKARGVAGWFLAALQRVRTNSLRRAPKNIAAHYDLGNAFYGAWLDPSMTYSAGLYLDETDDLERAQYNKNNALIEALAIGPDDHVLEIGCGWGGFACQAAKHTGCRVTAITLSPAQRDFVEQRIKAEGLSDRVSVREMDYRSVEGQFDKIVSIEMIEAVGERFWPIYFERVAHLLRPGGLFGLQAITIRDDAFAEYRKTSDFLQTYIFPGGMLLPEAGLRTLARQAGLEPAPPMVFGDDYAKTLVAWKSRFEAAWPEIAPMGFDERFQRMWMYYFATCEAGFRSGLITVSQTVFRPHPPKQAQRQSNARQSRDG
ncbi:MAG: cyclopropane-fatty-acyl-phospholipid synthase family protein [Pseudomonadota bacterium]